MTHLVLLGIGHAHLEVLRQAASGRLPGLRITLIAVTIQTMFSGLLPALIRGEIGNEDAHIACAPLAQAAGATLVLSEAIAIDLTGRHVLTRDAGFTGFDLLSINVDGAPAMPPGDAVAGAPVDGFIERLATLEAALPSRANIAVIGTDAGGTELALAMAMRLAGRAQITLLGPVPLHAAPAAARHAVARALHSCGVIVRPGIARGFKGGLLTLMDGTVLPVDAAIWATEASAPAFLARCGLACGPDGAVLTDAGLRSLSHEFVFAAGYSASLHDNPRPKPGAWAVGAGLTLAHNLRLAVAGRDILPWRPRRDALVILDTGFGHATAWRGGFSLSGRLPFLAKAWIDRRWMARYHYRHKS
jgi:selenide,water dikinase